MSREKIHEERAGGIIGPVIVMVVMSGIVYAVLQDPSFEIRLPDRFWKNASNLSLSSSSTTSGANSATGTSDLLVSIAIPNADRDRLFRVSFAARSVEELPAQTGWRETALTQKPLQLTVGKNLDDVMILSGGDWDVPLRTQSGVPYQEARFLGMFDATHAAVLARASDRMLLSVSRVGEIRELTPVTDNKIVLLMESSGVWLSSFVPGEGLESPPQGSSTLARVDGNGITATIATEPQVINLVVPGPGGAVAFATEQGDMAAKSEIGLWKGQGRPLVWLDEGRLVIAQGRGLGILFLQTGTIDAVVTLPAVPSRGVLSATTAP